MSTLDWATFNLRPDAPGFWLLLDILAGVGLWVFHARVARRWRNLAVMARWALPAYFALLAGALSPQQMGLTGNNWDAGLRIGLGFVVAILALVGGARLMLRDVPDQKHSPGSAASVVYTILHRGAEQFHWCFQRAAVSAIVLSAPAAPASASYWAIWGATLLAFPGALMMGSATQRIYTTVALLSTAILFFYTRNFWLCWALHAGVFLLAGATVESATDSLPDAADQTELA